MNDGDHIQELKEKEIKRLTTPLTHTKNKTFDCEGNLIETSFWNGKPFLEPKKGILTDDEILIYAGESKEASRIRLKRGEGNFNDKLKIYDSYLLIELLIFLPGFTLIAFSFWLWIALVVISLSILIYLLFIKDYTEVTTVKPKTDVEEQKVTTNDDLLLLFKAKEKIAREMIEKRFPAPQMTNNKFNSVLDNCKEVAESQIEILNNITLTDKTKYEIVSRKKLIKQLIGKVDDLTNELMLSEENNIEEVINDMDNLINSVKDYK